MTTRWSRRRLITQLALAGTAGITPALFGGCAPARIRGTSLQRPNIVFIMTDDHARSAMSLYGNPVLTTPHLDRIGNEGLRLDQAYVTCALCLPSRASFLSGQYPHIHGMRTNGAESGFTAEPALNNIQTWPNLLRVRLLHRHRRQMAFQHDAGRL